MSSTESERKVPLTFFSVGLKETNLVLVVIISIAVLVRLIAAFILGDQVEILPGIYDQISYHTLAIRILGGHGFTFDQEWWPLTQAGEPTAHWSYLYTFYLLVVYKIFGLHPLAARLIQAILAGIFFPLLTYRITIRVFNSLNKPSSARPEDILSPVQTGGKEIAKDKRRISTIALLAAAWSALYGYFIYYAAALMTETFYILAILWAFDISLRISESSKESISANRQKLIALFFQLGLALAIAVLLRQVFLIFVPFLFLWLLIVLGTFKRMPRGSKGFNACPEPHPEVYSDRVGESVEVSKRYVGPLLSLLILLLAILPFTILNYRQFDRFVLLNTNSGYAFFWANHPIHGNHFVELFTPDMPSYQALIPQNLRDLNEADLDSALLAEGFGFVLADPVRYVLLSLSRIPDHFIFWPLSSSPLLSNIVRMLSLGLALPFTILGIVLWFRLSISRNASLQSFLQEPGLLLFAFIFVYSMIHILSWAGIRYRLPTDAVMLVFASCGLYYVISKVFRKNEDCLLN